MDAKRLRIGYLLLEHLPFPTSAAFSILDFGCGTGEAVSLLWESLPFSQVYGADERSIIDVAKSRFPALRNRFLPFSMNQAEYDCVLTSKGLEEFADPEEALKMMRLLSRRWVIVTANRKEFDEIWWYRQGFIAYMDLTTEPYDGIRWVAIHDKERMESPKCPRVLISSPVRQHPAILHEFLSSLSEIEVDDFEPFFLFVDNNDSVASSRALEEFANRSSFPVIIWKAPIIGGYLRDERIHNWQEKLIWRVAALKDAIFEFALENEMDFVLSVDSDLVLHPGTVKRLLLAPPGIVSMVFWTKWGPDQPPLPNIWLHDAYGLYKRNRSEQVSPPEGERRIRAFLSALREEPGVYRVHGLGACTLFPCIALERGVRFSEIKGLMFRGEDRHLSTRAEALGIRLFADSTLLPFHIYRQSDLPKVSLYRKACRDGLSPREFIEKIIDLC